MLRSDRAALLKRTTSEPKRLKGRVTQAGGVRHYRYVGAVLFAESYADDEGRPRLAGQAEVDWPDLTAQRTRHFLPRGS